MKPLANPVGKTPTPRRSSQTTRLGAGLVLYGISIALMLTAALGADPWDVLHQGLSQHTGISVGWIVNGVGIVALLLWVPLRQRPGVGTMANVLVVGVVADLALGVLVTPPGLLLRLAMLVTGIVANGAATGLYIGAGLGPGPRDGLMTGLAAHTGRSIRSIRTAIEVAVLAAGWGLGGRVGLGTLLYAVSIGALSQMFLTYFSPEGHPPPPVRPPPTPSGAGRRIGLPDGAEVGAVVASQGQIDFYDDPRLIGPAADEIARFVAAALDVPSPGS